MQNTFLGLLGQEEKKTRSVFFMGMRIITEHLFKSLKVHVYKYSHVG